MLKFKVKKAFTLVELIIVIVLISSTYYLVFSSNNFSIQEQSEKVSLENLKEFLMKTFNFEKELSFSCIENDFTCYVKADGKLIKDIRIENFFKFTPTVYEYQEEEKRVEFEEIKIDDINYNVIFEFKINSDFKTNEFIVDTQDNKIYVFNSIFNKAKLYTSLNEAFEVFRTNKFEVKDAF